MFCFISFLVNVIRHIGPMVTMVARCTGSLCQLRVVERSWGKNLRKNQVFWSTFISGQFHQTHWSHGHHGHQVHRQPISASSGQNELGKKSKEKTSFLTKFYFLVNFIRHTGPMVTTGCSNVQTLISSVQTLMSNVLILISNVQNLYSIV